MSDGASRASLGQTCFRFSRMFYSAPLNAELSGHSLVERAPLNSRMHRVDVSIFVNSGHSRCLCFPTKSLLWFRTATLAAPNRFLFTLVLPIAPICTSMENFVNPRRRSQSALSKIDRWTCGAPVQARR